MTEPTAAALVLLAVSRLNQIRATLSPSAIRDGSDSPAGVARQMAVELIEQLQSGRVPQRGRKAEPIGLDEIDEAE